MDAGIECQGKVFGTGFQFGRLPAFAGDDAVQPGLKLTPKDIEFPCWRGFAEAYIDHRIIEAGNASVSATVQFSSTRTGDTLDPISRPGHRGAVGPAVDQFQNALSWSGSVIRRR